MFIRTEKQDDSSDLIKYHETSVHQNYGPLCGLASLLVQGGGLQHCNANVCAWLC
jgi:hypothetical protein